MAKINYSTKTAECMLPLTDRDYSAWDLSKRTLPEGDK
jgi:hypothetical protein